MRTHALCRAQTSESGWVRNCTCLTLTALASTGKDSLPASLQSPSQGGSKATGDHYSSCAIQSCLFSRGHRGASTMETLG